MILKIKKTGKIISKDLKIATSFIDQTLGLLKKSNPRFLLFYTRFGIHTLFLKHPIDVVICDEKLRIWGVKQDLKPNYLFFWNPKFPVILEMPKGTIKTFNLNNGDILALE